MIQRITHKGKAGVFMEETYWLEDRNKFFELGRKKGEEDLQKQLQTLLNIPSEKEVIDIVRNSMV
jgi:hypothetical protein